MSLNQQEFEQPSRLDSVLGDTNRDVLLKAVIQKADFAAKKVEMVDTRLTETVNAGFKD